MILTVQQNYFQIRIYTKKKNGFAERSKILTGRRSEK